ncbi:fasciclin domain-containing protein [Muricauda sp. SCSIO 64092]|uniref:fasciclin domain-containing protein n=1 Tax=Allomuricauda sp. SCSIO 64092 TaxID=2908842 RepID=UPI001FF45638|nr:fasciclin domain-containing protein [Muricauda sp. SCSIO 64092]UOY05636.1 fasciclin domain-containing protein [Muricauda sp. SCSIO 64092]
MRHPTKMKNYFLLFLITLLTFSCDEEDDGAKTMENDAPKSNIVETAADTEVLGSLVAALTKADENEASNLVNALGGEGPFTVFAPTNDAFNNLFADLDGFDSLDDFDTEEERDLLALILQYHVIAGQELDSENLSNEQELPTLLGENLTVSLDGGVFIQDATDVDAEVVSPDNFTSNGVVHIIDKVLLPLTVIEMLNGDTLVDIVVGAESLSLLEEAVIKADLVETLSGEGPFTVFAPDDNAFAALLDALGDDYNSLDDFDTIEEIALLTNILLYHVVPNETILKANLKEGGVPTALADNSLDIIASNDTFVIGDDTDVDANITATDFTASNGVAHIIDKVLLPQAVLDAISGGMSMNLVEIVVGTESLSLLEEAVITAGLAETLSGDGPFTVFAPTDDAFVALLDILGDDYNSLADFDTQEELDLLTEILLYHVLPQQVLEADLSPGAVPTALMDNSLEIIAAGHTFVIGDASDTDANITDTDILASNGVAHIIDKVLLPQAAIDFVMQMQMRNLVEIVVETDNLSLLEGAVIAAGLAGTLSGDGPFTVFAPTDDAFVALLDILGDDYNSLADFDTQEELDLLTDILLYHVLPQQVLEADLNPGTVPTALMDNSLEIIASGHTFVIGDASDTDANIKDTDILASNGVAHTIDKVLLPQAAIDFVMQMQMRNLVEIVVETDDLSLLEGAVIAAGLAGTLSGDGPFTVFAPTNDAFVALLDILGDDYNSLADFDTQEKLNLLTDILLYHVLPQQVLEADLHPGTVPTALMGNSLEVIASGHTFVIGDASDTDANIKDTDILASNGVAHTIDKVLLPQAAIDFVMQMQMRNLVEIVVETDDLSLLEGAVIAAGLAGTLSGDGPFTVFAPTDDAFVALLDILGDDYNSLGDFDTQEELDLLTNILLYHVLPQQVLEADLSPGAVPTALMGNSLEVIASGHTFVIGDASDTDANITDTDILASNGVAHTIDKVLLPQAAIDFVASLQEDTIVELAQSVGDLSLLVDALIQADAGLVEALQGNGPFTVFAPNNHAFQELFHLLGPDYHGISDFDTPEEKELLATVLSYHVLSGSAIASGEFDGHQQFKTEQGENISVDERFNGRILIFDKTHDRARVVTADNEASNGIVHIIDKVLLPQEVLDALH